MCDVRIANPRAALGDGEDKGYFMSGAGRWADACLRGVLGYGIAPDTTNIEAGEDQLGSMPGLVLFGALALLCVAISNILGRHGDPRAEPIFWASLICIVVPPVLRVVNRAPKRAERILLLSWLGLAMYLLRLLAHPIHYDHDEFLHWATAIDIHERHHLFTINSLLPVSPQFPGLEIVESALGEMSGLGVFAGGSIVVTVSRVATVCAIFLTYERIIGSAWVASLATLIYMANSNFISFFSMFSYETVAIELLTACLFLATVVASRQLISWSTLFATMIPLSLALAMSHHMTSWVGALLLVAITLVAWLTQWRRNLVLRMMLLTLTMLAGVLSWNFIATSHASQYIGGILSTALTEFASFMLGTRGGRTLFVADDGVTTPLVFRLIGLSSVALTCLGLSIGFFRSLALPQAYYGGPHEAVRPAIFGFRDNAFAIVLTVLTLGFPLSMALRLTSAGWELGNRMSGFVFFGVGLVVAVGIAGFWYSTEALHLRRLIVAAAISTLILGGAVAGDQRQLFADTYLPAADGQSVEAMGISAASWPKAWLGEGRRFASDRVNRLLLATYGVQRVVTSEQDREEPGVVLFNELGDMERNVIRHTRTEYLLVDLRLAQSRPKFGVYFSTAEDPALHQHAPLLDNLLKFDGITNVGRPYDNGYEVIYDVQGLLNDEP